LDKSNATFKRSFFDATPLPSDAKVVAFVQNEMVPAA